MIKCQKGMTLIEVLVAMVLLLILASGFVWAFGVNYTLLSGGKAVTSDTFEFQEMIENKIIEHKLLASQPGYVGSETIQVEFTDSNGPFTKTVIGDKIELEGTDVRYFYTFVSDTQIVTPPAPVIPGVTLRAYHPGDLSTETFPWIGSIIKADYDSSDPLIFGSIYRWYRSKSSSEPNPGYPGDYAMIIELIDDGTGTVVGDTLSADNTSDHGRYVYFGVTPFSPMGKMGREARNEERILIADPPLNTYWKNLIENAYLGNLHRLTDEAIFVETMLNNEELTLNVEINRNDSIPHGAYVFNPIPSSHHGKNFTLDIELEMYGQVFENDNYGFGIFLGDLTEGVPNSDSGYIIEFKFTNENQVVYLKEISNGIHSGATQSVNMSDLNNSDSNFELDWSKRYMLQIRIINNQIRVQLREKEDSDKISSIIGFNGLSSTINYKYIGLKTWSDYQYKDIDPYGLYGRMFTAHFYDISFSEIGWYASGGDDIYVENINGTNYVFHVFNTVGNSEFVVKENIDEVEILIVGGGGGGAGSSGNTGRGGGGSGGVVHVEGFDLSVGSYSIGIGSGGAGGPSTGGNGSPGNNSFFDSIPYGNIVAPGGGYGGNLSQSGGLGGSGGGAGVSDSGHIGGVANEHLYYDDPAINEYGYNGGIGGTWDVGSGAGGGGGAGGQGGNGGNYSNANGGAGGVGRDFSQTFSHKYGVNGWFGGGGGGSAGGTGGAGGSGGGGGGSNDNTVPDNGVNGTGGGGGGSQNGTGGSGGSGIVIIRYSIDY